MAGFWAKIILYPVILLVSDFLFNSVNYSNIYQPLAVGAVIAIFGHLMELLLLQGGRLWVNNTLDFIAALFIVYASQIVMTGAYISVFGAILVSLFILLTENIQHLYLIRGGKAEK